MITLQISKKEKTPLPMLGFDLLALIFLFLATLVGETFGTMFGGGGFFIQPALILIGIEPKLAIANDVAAACFSSFGFIAFQRKTIAKEFKRYAGYMLWMAIPIFLGTFLGAKLLKIIPNDVLTWVIIGVVVAGFIKVIRDVLLNSDHPDFIDHAKKQPIALWRPILILAALGLGFYDGFSGAGGGTLQILAFALILRFPMKELITLAVLFSSLSLTTASINLYFMDLLDWRLLAVMVPAAFLAGIIASKIVDLVSERSLKIVFAISLGILLTALLHNILF